MSLCYRCLEPISPDHSRSQCKSPMCSLRGRNHHALLHFSNDYKTNMPSSIQANPPRSKDLRNDFTRRNSSNDFTRRNPTSMTKYRRLIENITHFHYRRKHKFKLCALLDDGSTISPIDESLVEGSRLTKTRSNVSKGYQVIALYFSPITKHPSHF